MQNKVDSILLLMFAAWTLWYLEDATFFVFAMIVLVGIFFSKDNWRS